MKKLEQLSDKGITENKLNTPLSSFILSDSKNNSNLWLQTRDAGQHRHHGMRQLIDTNEIK